SRHQSRTTLKRSRSHDGSAIMFTATVMSSERANSSASKFLESVTRLHGMQIAEGIARRGIRKRYYLEGISFDQSKWRSVCFSKVIEKQTHPFDSSHIVRDASVFFASERVCLPIGILRVAGSVRRDSYVA